MLAHARDSITLIPRIAHLPVQRFTSEPG